MHQKSNEDILKDVNVADYNENGKKVCCLFFFRISVLFNRSY